MNLLIINYEYPPLGGGGGIVTKALAEGLVKRNHQVTVLTTKVRGEKSNCVENGVKVVRVPVLGRNKMQTASMLSMFTWPLTSISAGIFLCLKNKYDLINTHFFAPTGPTGSFLSLLFNIPNVIYAHGGDVYNPERNNKTPSGKGLLAKLLKVSLNIQVKFARGILTQSSDTKKRIQNLVPEELKSKIEIIPWAFSPPVIKATNKKLLDHGKFNLISIGRVVKRKGYQYLLNAIKNLPPKIVLNIIGDGPELENLKQLSEDLEIKDQVKFWGYVDDLTKFELLEESDCYVLSSLHEGMGVVLVEAMHCGLPIVSTNHGGQVDLITDHENGILVNPKDSKALTDGIKKLFFDTKLQQKFSVNNEKKVRKYYAENIADEYEEYFKKSFGTTTLKS